MATQPPNPIRLLYIENDTPAAHLLQKKLEQTGYRVDIAGNGREGVRMFNAARYDLLLVDAARPGSGGVEVLHTLAEQGPLPPAILLTDDGNKQTTAAALQLGIDDYLVKDPNRRYLALLPALVEHVLRKHNILPEARGIVAGPSSLEMDEREQRVLAETLRWAGTVMLNKTINYDEVLDQIVEQVGRVTPHDAACILLIEDGSARVARWRGYRQFGTEDAIAAATFNIATVTGLKQVYHTRRALAVPYAEPDDEWVTQSGQEWVKSYVTIPVGTTAFDTYGPVWDIQKLICFLHVDSATPGFFTQIDAERLQAFANQAGIALENARLYDQAKQTIIKRVRALKKERNFISTILETASALIVILNPRGRIIHFNRTCEKVTGYTFDEVRGSYVWDLFTAADEQEAVRAYFEQLPLAVLPNERESYWITKSGDHRLIAWSDNVLFDNTGEVEYIISSGIDITERKAMEEALRASEERYALIALSANDGLWDWDLQTNHVYFSSRWKAMLGYSDEQIGHSPVEWFGRVHPEDLEQLKADIVRHLEAEPASFKNEHRILHKNGAYRWVLSQGLAVRNLDGQAYRMAGSLTDITQRKLTEEKLMHSALHDALTGLPNRVLFRARLERAIERSQEEKGYLFAVLFLDLDRFKVINDSLGHIIGDQLLVSIARRLKSHLRKHDTVARLGGDEFAILLDGIKNPGEATRIANRVQTELARPVKIESHELFITTSIGIALNTITYEWPEDILRDADMAMYQAKAGGRARHEVFEIDMRTHAVAIWQLEAELRQAIDNQEFQLYYQPFVSLKNGQITGVEALLRWQHPRRGLIIPDEFIPLAEEIGLIMPIGAWVLQTACAQAKQWRQAGFDHLRVSVNVSPAQLQSASSVGPAHATEGTLPRLVKKILDDTGLPPRALELEITENVSLLNSSFGQMILDSLSRLGVRIAVDDFGMGSSLDFLRQFPIDTLKVDQSFVKDMLTVPNDRAFIKAIIAMSHSLNLKVVAEGVENRDQLDFLQAQQCDEVQGNLFSPALSAADMTALLQAGPNFLASPGEE